MSIVRKLLIGSAVALAGLVSAGCQKPEPAATSAASPAEASKQVTVLADELLAHLEQTYAMVKLARGAPIEAFDPITLESAQAQAKFGRDALQRLDAIAIDSLPGEQWLLAKLLRHTFATQANADNS